jgi:hypothetical protein
MLSRSRRGSHLTRIRPKNLVSASAASISPHHHRSHRHAERFQVSLPASATALIPFRFPTSSRMDHFPRPNAANRLADDSRRPGTKLLSNVHDGIPRDTFEEYPLRRGFSSAKLSAGDFRPDRSQQAAALVQNWPSSGSWKSSSGFPCPRRTSSWLLRMGSSSSARTC